ncbi:VTC domain-containing protein [Rutstroemia sp. NJR-2017a WRK4]|nr:VTC domain-containing protein [Rutstroemia sp. NJR-2017a WRK4]
MNKIKRTLSIFKSRGSLPENDAQEEDPEQVLEEQDEHEHDRESPRPPRERRKHHRRSRRNRVRDRDDDGSSSRRHHTPHPASSNSLDSKSRMGESLAYSEEGREKLPERIVQWPPVGYTFRDKLSQGKAMELVATGVPVFKGLWREIPHASDEYYALFVEILGNGGAGTDRAFVFKAAFAADSFYMLEPKEDAHYGWETLEQPSMAFCYGVLPGTVTLNHWVGLAGRPNPAIELRDSGVLPRDVALGMILERLQYLETGWQFEEDRPEIMYKNLYKTLLKDPDRLLSPHKGMERQIADLITVLSRHEWIDFSKPHNQIVAKFFVSEDIEEEKLRLFLLQVLLSIELDWRIHSKHHSEDAKARLLLQLPPWIAWDLALARKWRDCIGLDAVEPWVSGVRINYIFKAKERQIKALRKFARAMKWPNLAGVDRILRAKATENLDDLTIDASAYFSGLILPGTTLPWLIMNTLIDCDDDPDALELTGLTHILPNTGFQYKNASFWSSTCIIGKVLAPTCRETAGWIGPAICSPDLDRTQVIRTAQKPPRHRITKVDVMSMRKRSDPLGPPAEVYPVADYVLPVPDFTNVLNANRIEKLAITEVPGVGAVRKGNAPGTYRASIIFAIHGRSWPLHLSHDVQFISAYPCSEGPHPLFHDYEHRVVRADEILEIRDWGNLNPAPGSGSGSGSGSEPRQKSKSEADSDEMVLVVEAWGVKDNEVLARAWCAHWGLSAVVADVRRGCVACAVREAYAAGVVVVILIEGEEEEGR